MVAQLPSGRHWALLSYRVPREPSTPRIAIWRRLKGHGVAQIGDGLVALPFDARTKEQLEWVAEMVLEADGEAIVWVAVTAKQEDARLVTAINADRTAEYAVLIDEVKAAGPAADGRTIGRFRRALRRIERRDHFGAPLSDEARLAVDAHTAATAAAADGSGIETANAAPGVEGETR